MRHVSHGICHLLLTLSLTIPGPPLLAQEQTLVIGTVGGQFDLASPADARPFINHLENTLPGFKFAVHSDGTNGRELAEKFLQQYPDTRCLFTSGYADDEVALYGVIQDRIAFLSKPYSPHDLLAKAREVLTAAEPQRPLS